MPCFVTLGVQFPSEQRGVGEESFNALRFAGAAGQFTGAPTVQLCGCGTEATC